MSEFVFFGNRKSNEKKNISKKKIVDQMREKNNKIVDEQCDYGNTS